jgi:hypothetical protein
MIIGNFGRILALGLMLSMAVIASPVHAEPIGSNNPACSQTTQKCCYIPGSDLPYLPGEKATFSKDGQPAQEHTCKSDGTWTALIASPTWLPIAPFPVSRFP